MKDWFKARNIWGAAILSMSDAEAGRFAKALWTYTMTGEQQNLSGTERGAFAIALMTLGQDDQIDADLSQVRAKAGSKGGQAKQANANFAKTEEANVANATNKNKEKEEESDNYYGSNSARAWVTDTEVQESLERDRQIEEAARRWGLPCQEGHMIHARDLARDYTLDWLIRAIETAGGGKEQTWRYVDGILRSYRENGGPDAPRKQRPSAEKTVSAQKYTQRGNDELDPIYFGDSIDNSLLDEARKMRDEG